MSLWETEEAAAGDYRGVYDEQLERYMTLFSAPRDESATRSPWPTCLRPSEEEST
jgi:hypothetical protein